MQQTEPMTVSTQLKPGRDDEAIRFLSQPHINKSEAIRRGIELYIELVEGKSNPPQAVTEVKPLSFGDDNPFLNASP